MSELRRKGRPMKDEVDKRGRSFHVHLRDDEYEMMIDLAEFYDISLGDVLRYGLSNSFELHKQGRDIRYYGD